MVTTAELSQRIDLNLRIVRLKIDDLPELDQAWPDETRENRFMEFQEWEDTIARLRSLREAHEQTQMTERQQRRYQELLAKLHAAKPTLVRLGLATSNDISRVCGG
jgi:hypothetical protein